MDLSLSADQRDLVDTLARMLDRGTRRDDTAPNEFDVAGFDQLERSGFLDVVSQGGALSDACLVVEQVGVVGLTVPAAARAVVAPLMRVDDIAGVVGLADRTVHARVRFAQQADVVLALDGDEAVIARAGDFAVRPAEVRWGYPVGDVDVTGGQRLGPGSADRLRTAWRIALAAEIGGITRAAVQKASQYVTEREQFGRQIGAFQSVKHRLARGWARSEGVTWLARRAAWEPDEVVAAAAACYACETAREVFRSVHQVVGAMGITDEFRLTALTSKLASLHTELGGAAGHARSLAHARWDLEQTG